MSFITILGPSTIHFTAACHPVPVPLALEVNLKVKQPPEAPYGESIEVGILLLSYTPIGVPVAVVPP